MTYRSREDHMRASDELTPFLPGSFVYCHPSEVETWTQSVPFGDFALPSPPETSSDCGSLDSQDMSSQTWSQASQPEEWIPVSAQEYSTYQQPSASGWTNSGMPVTASDIQTLDNAAWLSVSSGPVDQGLSPVLSHESQSTHTLTSFSEPDPCVLPPGLDLSFATGSSWNPNEPAVYSSTASFHHAGEQGFAPSIEAIGKSEGLAPFPQGYYPVAHPAMFFPQGGQPAYAPRTSHPTLAPKRQLLPRTETSSQSSPASNGTHRLLRPYVQGQRESHATLSSVSSAAGQPHQGPQHAVAQAGHATTSSAPARPTPTAHHGLQHHTGYTQATAASQTSAPAHYMVDPTAQDFCDFIHFDQEDHSAPPAHMSYTQGFDVHSVPSVAPVDSKDMMPRPEQDVNAMYQDTASGNASLAGETDEGRHRSHPLYAAEPRADGLFHCPYEGKDANCPHKPTKLKCNYEYDPPCPADCHIKTLITHLSSDSKYVDSHLKPFRCKIETCSKQEFSSTACLLRHEREAHGMHGHGDRPHLCFYTGCERGIPGNGFPRRYNLFDHMKRVHDHKEDPRAGTRSPSVGNSQDKKASASRKRKASEPAPLESAAQRQRIMPVAASHAQSAPAPQVYTVQPQDYFQQPMPAARRTQAHARVYHHWANQRDLIERQMGSVQSPDDEAGLQRLTQNVEEFRRLSDLVRRG